jgi:transposase-like protein
MSTMLELAKIRMDGGTQPRTAIDFEAVGDYMDAMKDGVKFPPVDVFYDGTDYWLADGFHRVKAAFGAELSEIACNVHQGTQADAQWFSFSANKSNGLRRTNEDKQRAVKAALAHPKSGKMSDNAIAKHIGVHHDTVSEWRKKSASLSESASETESALHVSNAERRICSDGRVMNTANIGKSRKTVPIKESAPESDAYVADDQYQEPEIERDAEAEPEVATVAQLEEPPICDRKVAGSTPAGGSITRQIAPPKPGQVVDKAREAEEILRALNALAEHQISSADFIATVPDGDINLLYQKSRAAFEFIGFIFDAAGKRQRGVA